MQEPSTLSCPADSNANIKLLSTPMPEQIYNLLLPQVNEMRDWAFTPLYLNYQEA